MAVFTVSAGAQTTDGVRLELRPGSELTFEGNVEPAPVPLQDDEAERNGSSRSIVRRRQAFSAVTETADRTWNQYVGEAVYRFLDDQLYVAGRYNTAKGQLIGITGDVGVNRYQMGGGWFVTPNILMKAEYVNQKYNDFPSTDIRSGGKFKGLMIEGVVAF